MVTHDIAVTQIVSQSNASQVNASCLIKSIISKHFSEWMCNVMSEKQCIKHSLVHELCLEAVAIACLMRSMQQMKAYTVDDFWFRNSGKSTEAVNIRLELTAIISWRRWYWPRYKEQPEPNLAKISWGLQYIPDNGREMAVFVWFYNKVESLGFK